MESVIQRDKNSFCIATVCKGFLESKNTVIKKLSIDILTMKLTNVYKCSDHVYKCSEIMRLISFSRIKYKYQDLIWTLDWIDEAL